MKRFKYFLEYKKYSGEALEKGGTSIQGEAAPEIKKLFASGVIKPGMRVLDYGAGKYGRNANFLRENGVEVYAYDPFNGKHVDGWDAVSTDKPSDMDSGFDLGFTSYVLNVVPEDVEDTIIKDVESMTKESLHITRNRDIFDSVKKALLRGDTTVTSFYLEHFADTDEERQMAEDRSYTDEVIEDFVHHGVQTSRGFQRIPQLEEKGFHLSRKTSGFKVYRK